MKNSKRYAVIFETSFWGKTSRQYRETTVKRFRSFESAEKFAEEKSLSNSACNYTSYSDQKAFYVVKDNVSGKEKTTYGTHVPTVGQIGIW